MKPKKVNYELIQTKEPYRLLKIALKWHEDLNNAELALAWRKELKPDVDGHLILGRCVKVTDLNKELRNFDFIILLNKEVWDSPEFVEEKKLALLDHELCHAAPVCDKEGEPKIDDRGRPVWRSRKHDIEEFRSVVARHGCYKGDLEDFAKAVMNKNREPLFSVAK